MSITIIAALAKNYVIGKEGTLPWDLPDDLKRFRNMIQGKHVIMGRKTYESIGRPLSGCETHVLTADTSYVPMYGGTVHHTLDEVLRAVNGAPEVCVAGGADIYKMFLPLATSMELTWVNKVVSGDTFFPAVDWTGWKEQKRDEKEGYTFVSYIPKRS